jgi:chromate transporter
LFTFAAYLGALIHIGPQGIIGASLALFAIFLPGTLLITGALPFWSQWRALASAQAFIKGTNAAVVGLLAYALYASLLLPTIRQSSDVMLTVVGFCLLVYGRLPPWIIVAAGVAISLLMNEHVTLWG